MSDTPDQRLTAADAARLAFNRRRASAAATRLLHEQQDDRNRRFNEARPARVLWYLYVTEDRIAANAQYGILLDDGLYGYAADVAEKLRDAGFVAFTYTEYRRYDPNRDGGRGPDLFAEGNGGRIGLVEREVLCVRW